LVIIKTVLGNRSLTGNSYTHAKYMYMDMLVVTIHSLWYSICCVWLK